MATILVLSADTLVRFRNGRILVHTTSSPLPAFETGQAMIVGWLCRFAAPTDPDTAIAALPPDDRKRGGQLIDYLIRSGVLVAAGSQEARDRPTAESAILIRNHLRVLARSVYDLACDVLGMGPEMAERALAEQSGIGLERRLMAALASLDGLRNELLPARRSRTQAQLESLGIDPASKGLQLHIGCGTGHLPGWINIDVHPAPLAMTVLWGLPFPDRSVSRVFVSHMLEHLFFPRDVLFFLGELKRVMAPGSVARIVVPDIGQCIAAYESNDRSFFASRRETWSWWPEGTTRLQDFLNYAGAGPEPAHLFEAHKYGYDFETLEKVLGEAGFEHIRASAYMASEDPALRVDHISAVASARYGERFYSLFVEASTPAR
jgi:SAM-dependent methyltransferase